MKESYRHLILYVFSAILLFFSCFTCVYAPVGVGAGVTANPLSLTIGLGGSGQSVITVSGKGNPSPWPVDLSASSISGVSTGFDPQQVIIPPSEGGEWNNNQSTLTISVSSSATPGVYNLTVYADFDPFGTLNVNITLTILSSEYESVVVGGYVLDSNPLETVIAWITSTVMMTVIIAVTTSARGKTHRK